MSSSTATETADLDTVERGGLTVTILDTPDLGDRSYVVDDGTCALVIDPQRDLDRVESVLAVRDLTLVAVAETHLHNDYVSGGLELARRHDVDYLVPCEAEVAYERTLVCGQDVRRVASMTVRTLATPGHTPHHVAFAVGVGEQPLLVFTGGSLLFGAVGRTDLVSPDLTEQLTRAQWASVRRLADELPADAAVLPTHGFGSFCSATPTSGSASTMEQQRRDNPAFAQDEETFVRELLAGFDAYPAYYAHMGPINAAGPAPLDLSPTREADPAELRRRLDAGQWVVDLRSRTAFARGHLPGTFNVEGSGNLPTYLGWIFPWGTPLTLLGDSPEQVADAQRKLARIGIDRPAAQATGTPERWTGGEPLACYDLVTFADLAAARDRGPVHVLDVRRQSEWDGGHIDGAQHLPLRELADRLTEVPDTPIFVHCGSGYRASIAGSLLDRAGKTVTVVDGNFTEAEPAGLPVC